MKKIEIVTKTAKGIWGLARQLGNGDGHRPLAPLGALIFIVVFLFTVAQASCSR